MIYRANMKFLFGKKLEMSQIFSDEGRVIPVTKIKLFDDVKVFALLSEEKNGYTAVRAGAKFDKKVKDKILPSIIKEIRVKDTSGINEGDELLITQFNVGDKVTLKSVSKGKGFAGVVKRHGFHGSDATHGTKHVERAGGSIGSGFPQHVLKGRKMPGKMGSVTQSIKNVKIVSLDQENNILVIKGPVPGARGSIIQIIG